MKKTIKLLTAILASIALTGCNETSATTEPVQEYWTETDLSTMKKVLADVELPFFYIGDYEVEASATNHIFTVTVENVTYIELKNIEKAFKSDPDWDISTSIGSDSSTPYFGSATYSVYPEIGTTQYYLKAQYGIYTGSGSDFGTVSAGTIQFAAVMYAMLGDYSASYETYTGLVAGLTNYFDKNGYTGFTLPTSLTSSATGYELTDYRYLYWYMNEGEADLGYPYAMVDFLNAKEEEVATIKSELLAFGYKEGQSKTSSGEAYTFYELNNFRVVVNFEEASETYNTPDLINLQIAPITK